MKNNARHGSSRGQLVVVAMMALVILAILVPVLVYLAQKEATWSAKSAYTDIALRMAETGQEKAYIMLSQNPTNWTSLISGTQLTDFKFDHDWNDLNTASGRMNQGQYTVSITSGPGANQVTVISVGEDLGKVRLHAIQAIYDEEPPAAAIFANAFNSTMTMHWGPIMSATSITFPSTSTLTSCYPQMSAVTTINVNRSQAACFGGASSWSAAQSPCTDGKLWWAYNCPPGVPSLPTVDLAAYKAMALASSCPTSAPYNFPAGASVAGSCNWSSPPAFNGSTTSTSSTTIYATSIMVINTGQYIKGSIIINGSLTVNSVSGGAPMYAIPDATFSTLGISSTAWQQYQGGTPAFDTSAAGEWPGDAGGGPPSAVVTAPPTNGTFSFNCPLGTCPTLETGTQDDPMIRGFIYVNGNATFNTNFVYHGVMIVGGTVTTTGGAKLTGYYDPAVAANILITNSIPSRISWKDVVYTSWPGP